MATIVGSASGGNWNSTGSWVGGVVPTSSDNVQLKSTTGNITLTAGAACRSFDCVSDPYTGVFTHPAGVTFTVGDSTAGPGALIFALSMLMTYTIGATFGSVLSLASTSATQQTITTNGKSLPTLIFGTNGAGSSIFQDSFTTPGQLQHNAGIVNTNDQACSWGNYLSNNTNIRTLTPGNSTIMITRGSAGVVWNVATSTNFTITPNTATIILTGGTASWSSGSTNYVGTSVILSGTGTPVFTSTGSFTNVSRLGTAITTDTILIGGNFTFTNSLTLAGNSHTNRLGVSSSTPGTHRTITAGPNAVFVGKSFVTVSADITLPDNMVKLSVAPTFTSTVTRSLVAHRTVAATNTLSPALHRNINVSIKQDALLHNSVSLMRLLGEPINAGVASIELIPASNCEVELVKSANVEMVFA